VGTTNDKPTTVSLHDETVAEYRGRLARANQRYINGDIDLEEFEQAVDWALAAETRELDAG
jgi:hypothetical protein